MMTATIQVNGEDVGRLKIVNDGKGSEDFGNYHVEMWSRDGRAYAFVEGVNRNVSLWDFLSTLLQEPKIWIEEAG